MKKLYSVLLLFNIYFGYCQNDTIYDSKSELKIKLAKIESDKEVRIKAKLHTADSLRTALKKERQLAKENAILSRRERKDKRKLEKAEELAILELRADSIIVEKNKKTLTLQQLAVEKQKEKVNNLITRLEDKNVLILKNKEILARNEQERER